MIALKFTKQLNNYSFSSLGTQFELNAYIYVIKVRVAMQDEN